MFETDFNHKTVTLKLERIEVCNLLLACTAMDQVTDEETQKWHKLHEKIRQILNDWDEDFWKKHTN